MTRERLRNRHPRDYEGLSPSFAVLCREADKAQRRKPADPHLGLLRQLMRDDVSLEQAWRVLNRAAQLDRAASATVEALMHSLRERRTAALTERDTQRRIGELSEAQVREVGARLRALKITTPWSAAEIERLLKTWIACHA
jgi:hypothetical protein